MTGTDFDGFRLPSRKGSLTERIASLHQTIIERMPSVDRIACALYHPGTDMLKTFLNSTRTGVPIAGYEFPLAESESLTRLAGTGLTRVIDDIPAVLSPSSPHSKWLLEQGYQSSFTVPMYDMGRFLGFLFFNSMEKSAFTDSCQRDLLLYSNLIIMPIAAEKGAVRAILNSATVAREIAKLRDFETGAHLERMALYARLIALGVAEAYGLSDEQVEHIYLFAPLHDIGKIGIPDDILLKPGRLDEHERRIMEGHVALGLKLAETVLFRLGVRDLPDSSVMTNIIANHHELLDGSGYPRGISGDQIPVEARIVTVADIFDALTAPRPYKRPWSLDSSFAELERLTEAGKLDLNCVSALRQERAKVENILHHHQDPEEPGPEQAWSA